MGKLSDGFVLTALYTGIMMYRFIVADEMGNIFVGVGGTGMGAIGIFSNLCLMGENCDEYDRYSRSLKQLTSKPDQKYKK